MQFPTVQGITGAFHKDMDVQNGIIIYVEMWHDSRMKRCHSQAVVAM